jgi:decaprenylphospho-beta-D-ribofuranose 2-oxidase
VKVSGWGRYPWVDASVSGVRSVADVSAAVSRAAGSPGGLTVRGLGRSYGDSSLGSTMLDLTGLDSLVAFDPETGVLTCEAGVSLSTLITVLLPRGWFLPVTPGTRYVTVGGAIASDVHGKNHHVAGAFSEHVLSLSLMVASGEVLTVSPDSHPELWQATCGGMGLTGVILSATIQMIPVQSRNIDELLIRTSTLGETLEAFDEHASATYSVAWIDLVARGASLGRSLVMLGEHATDGDLSVAPGDPAVAVPVDVPSVFMNRATVTAFNALYYGRVRQPSLQHVVGLEAFFYPLDKAADWNRLYGRRGFLQYQFVIPFAGGAELLEEIVARVADAGLASPLAVLKVMGSGNSNMLGFCAPGYTLALDLKLTPRALALCSELDALVVAAGGRLYLTKDSRMSPDTFRACYPRLDEFEAVRSTYGAAGVFVSEQSKRLGLA